MKDSDLQNYGQINFELNSTQLSISFNNENVLIKVPFSFNILWKNIFSVVSKNKVNGKGDTILVLAWNFFEDIKKNNKTLSDNFINIKSLEKEL